jgi:hypothetical protein
MKDMGGINLITVCTDVYPIEYAEKLIHRVLEVSEHPIVPYCITDRDIPSANTIEPQLPKGSGWWNKIQVFDPKGPVGWNLYMDIDIVVAKGFDEVINHVITNIEHRDSITCVSDAINWMDNKFSTSWMMFHRGVGANIYDTFWQDSKEIMKRPGGDQVWIGKEINPLVKYIDDTFPWLKKNLKFDMSQKIFNEWQFPRDVDKRISLIDCGGRPKPHDLIHLPYIKQNWHDVRI